MQTSKWCFGDTLADPGSDLKLISLFNEGSEAAMNGTPMSDCPLPVFGRKRPYWIAGWRVTRMTTIAKACGELASAEEAKASIATQRSAVHKHAVGIRISKLG